MKKISLLIILAIFSISCSKNSDDNEAGLSFLKSQGSCDESNLDWLNKKIEELTPNLFDSYFLKGNYKGDVVFVLSNCCELCNSAYTVYDCSGEFLGVIIDILIEDITQQELVWPKISDCF